MIISDLTHFERERALWPAAVVRGIEYILERRLGECEPGRYDLEGDNGHLMYANVQEVETRPKADQLPESHQIYTDIQFIASGEERLCFYKLHEGARVIDDKFETHDIAFYENEGTPETDIYLGPGMFAVCFPSDIHRPNCIVTESRVNKKVVIKIHRDLLGLG